MPRLLLISLGWLSIYLFVVVPRSVIAMRGLICAIFNCVLWVTCLIVWETSALVIVDQVNHNRFIDGLPVKLSVHDQSFSIREEHQPLRARDSSSILSRSARIAGRDLSRWAVVGKRCRWIGSNLSNLVVRPVNVAILSIFLAALRHLLPSPVIVRVIILSWLGIFSTSIIARVATIRVLLLPLLFMLRLQLKRKTCWAAIQPWNHLLLEVRFCGLQQTRKLVLIGQLNDLNHFGRVSYAIQHIEVIKVTEINYLFEWLELDLPLEVNYHFFVLLSWDLRLVFRADLLSHVFKQKLGKNKRLASDDAHVPVDFYWGGRFLLLLPKIVKFFLLFVFVASAVVWRSLRVLISGNLGDVLLRLLSVENIGLRISVWVKILNNSDIRVSYLNLLLSRPMATVTVFHLFVRITLLAQLRIITVKINLIILIWLILTIDILPCIFWNGRVILVKAFENHICIETVRILLVHVLKKRWWLRLNNTDVMDSTAGNFDDFSMH